MAIISEIQSTFGVACTYSKIDRYSETSVKKIIEDISPLEELVSSHVAKVTEIEVTLACFYNKEARDNNLNAITYKSYHFSIENYLQVVSESGMNHIQYIYNKICELEGYIGDENIS